VGQEEDSEVVGKEDSEGVRRGRMRTHMVKGMSTTRTSSTVCGERRTSMVWGRRIQTPPV
jgi:hypothetical protein